MQQEQTEEKLSLAHRICILDQSLAMGKKSMSERISEIQKLLNEELSQAKHQGEKSEKQRIKSILNIKGAVLGNMELSVESEYLKGKLDLFAELYPKLLNISTNKEVV